MRVISEQIEVIANGHENENGEDSGAHSSPIVGSLPLLQSTMILLREHQASASFHAGHKKLVACVIHRTPFGRVLEE
jgi:hypothetical protein